jgi:hypothetical protein
MKGSMRQRGSAWELRVYLGADPVTGKQRYATKTVRAGKREAQRLLNEMTVEAERGLATRTTATWGAARPLARARPRGLLAQDDPGGRRVHRAQPAAGARRRAAQQADDRVARSLLPLAARRRRPQRSATCAGHDPSHPRHPAAWARPGGAMGLARCEPGRVGVTAARAAAGDRAADARTARQAAEGDRRERSGVRRVRPTVGLRERAEARCSRSAGPTSTLSGEW